MNTSHRPQPLKRPDYAARLHLPARAALAIIDLYRLMLSPMVGPACRFEPSCSLYARQAIAHWGLIRGGWMALRRLLRCHPLGGFGYDPVPLETGGRG